MSNEKRRGRPRKDAGVPENDVTTATTASTQVDTPKTTVGDSILTNNDALLRALETAQRQLEALKLVNRYSDKPVVVVHHSGHGPQLCLPIEGEKSILLDPNGSSSQATIPLVDYLSIEKNTPWVKLGYMYADEGDSSNPNLIIDIQKWFDSHSEGALLKQIASISSEGILHALYDFTENITKTGKVIVIRNAVARKMEDVLDIIVSEDLSLSRESIGKR